MELRATRVRAVAAAVTVALVTVWLTPAGSGALDAADDVSVFACGMTGGESMTGCVELAADGELRIDDGGDFGAVGEWQELFRVGALRFLSASYDLDGVTYDWWGATLGGGLLARVSPTPRTLAWGWESECAPAAPEPPRTTGLLLDEPGTDDGYLLFSPNLSTDTFLVDRAGEVVNRWDLAAVPGLIAYLLPDGSLVRASAPRGPLGGAIPAIGGSGLIERFS